jgi:dTDP-4-amino-4,6-dideoxygalactose transaminase
MPTHREVPALPLASWQMFSHGTTPRPDTILSAEHTCFTTSGRAAIALGLELLGVGPGHKVLVPTYHCPTMIAPIVKLGGSPLFYPLTSSGAPDLEYIQQHDEHPVTAMLVPHYFGLPQPMTKIRDFCDEHQIALIEDCAHAFFGRADGHPIGAWGDVAIASITKFFPAPDGGVLRINRPPAGSHAPALTRAAFAANVKAMIDVAELAAKYHRLRGLNTVLNALFSAKRKLRLRGQHPTHTAGENPVIDSSCLQTAPTAMQAFDLELARLSPCWVSSALARFTSTSRIAERRRINYARLCEALSGHTGCTPLRPDLPKDAVPYVFPLRVQAPDEKHRELRRRGIPVFRWNMIWPGTPSIDGDIGLTWASQIFQLPCHQDLTEEDLDVIQRNVLQVCGERVGANKT